SLQSSPQYCSAHLRCPRTAPTCTPHPQRRTPISKEPRSVQHAPHAAVHHAVPHVAVRHAPAPCNVVRLSALGWTVYILFDGWTAGHPMDPLASGSLDSDVPDLGDLGLDTEDLDPDTDRLDSDTEDSDRVLDTGA